MEKRRISMHDIVVGQPLPWDVYDAANHLLLRRGYTVESEQQLEALVERGLFVESHASEAARKTEAAALPETPSVVRLLNLANKRLERLLYGIYSEAEIGNKILEVAKIVGHATTLNADLALACILLNQDGARYPIRHSIDTAIVVLLLARALKKPADEIYLIAAAALTMNVGMLRQQEQLQSRPDALTEKERAIIRAHPEEGARILREVGIDDEEWLSYVLLHHENADGSGYPFGRRGDDIPANAKLISLADRYCARISARAYRKPLLPNAALRDILLSGGDQIEPALAAVLVREMGTYPSGSFVRLENGEVGIVSGKGASTTTPFVHALVGPRGAPLAFAIKRDTSKDLHAIREVLHEEQAGIHVNLEHIWGKEASP